MYPPLVLNPPINKRTGQFIRVDKNPLELLKIKKVQWLCYPAKVGKLLIAVYFNKICIDLFIDCLLLFKSFNTLFLNNKYYLN